MTRFVILSLNGEIHNHDLKSCEVKDKLDLKRLKESLRVVELDTKEMKKSFSQNHYTTM